MKTLVALALIPFVAAAAPSPVLSGLYSVGELGLVQFSVVDGKFVGKVRLAAECPFAAETQVVTGVFEGGVFVGNVTLCQTGAGCPAQRTYPLLAVAHDDAVGGVIRLDAGCRSPALDDRALFIRPATAEEKARLSGDASASATAQKQNKKPPAEQAADAIIAGNKLAQDSHFAEARDQFRLAMELDDVHWEAALGYGMTEVRLNRADRSLPYFDKALTLAQANKANAVTLAQIHYNRGCAQVAVGDKKGAIASVRMAVKLGGAANYLDQLTDDGDLDPIRNEAEFRRLVADAQLQFRKKR